MSVDKILENIKLPTLSKTLNEIIELEKNNPVSIFNDLIKIIEKDPLLSVHIMKIANSPLHGFAKSVRSISHAVSLLGSTQIRNIAFSFSIFDFIKKINYSKGYGKVFKSILKRSSMMSSVAGIIAKNKDYHNSDELYISGLVANLGQILLFLYSPKKYSKIFTQDKDLLLKEKKEFGINFMEIGIAFCKREGLPFFLESAINNQFKLSEKTELNKIIYITRGITDFLLTDTKKEKKIQFSSLEKEVKDILDLSMEDINNTIKDLPLMMDTFMTDFPEVQSELNKIINTSSEIIINLMKKELDLVLQSKEQIGREKHISKEKQFITHMLNLSKEFSVLLQPDKMIAILTDYFDKNLIEYKVKVLYRNPQNKDLTYFCDDKKLNGRLIEEDSATILTESKKKDEPLFASRDEVLALGLEPELNQIVFPVSYHKTNFGFLILGADNSLMKNIDYVISYLRIISNIIANSFQNYLSFVNLKKEKDKKEKIANELITNDKKLLNYELNETILSRSNVLEEILPVIFHKLKNKLTPILGYSQLLVNLSENNSIVEKLKRIERNANELTSIIDCMSHGFKSEELAKKNENLNEILNKMEPFFLSIEESKKISIEFSLDHSIKNFLLSRGQIINMVMNLVENSVDALQDKDEKSKKIEIKTFSSDNIVKLIIRDNGKGIADEDLLKIWSPFYSKYEIKAGIGLTACERVLMNHHAKYSFNSEVGVFTEFTAEFPLDDVDEKQQHQKRDVSSGTGLNILILDDEEPLVILMKEILQIHTNLNIFTVTKGADAIQLINENKFDLIISDIQMPGINGIDIFNHLKSKGIEDRLLMVTGNPYINEIAKFLKKNKIKFLKKPFELMRFRRLVNERIETTKEK